MCAALAGNEKLAGQDVAHLNSDCQERKVALGSEGIIKMGGIKELSAMWFWLLHVGAVVRLRNFAV